MLGHELRNPLAPMVTALQLIKLRGGDAGLSREHQVIERQLDHMKRLVDDLLDVSRLARGKIQIAKEPIDLRIAIAHAVEIAGPLVEERGHDLGVRAPNRPVIVDGDESRLTQVFANLLTNAAKYTDPGGRITVNIRRRDDDIVVEVRDNGTGLDPELLPKVFDLFVQGERDPDHGSGGLGLGLALVKSLVGLHGGTVEAHSTGRHMGSTFTVTLPAVEPDRASGVDSMITTAFAPAAHKRRVLVVDDNEDARVLLADILGKLGLDVQAAADAAEAIAVAATFSPEVAVLDLGLPDLDGHALGIRLREMLPKIQLIALSGYGQAADQAKSQEAGFQRHLVKPVDVRRLMDAIGELI
jgi:CheY-like chemotaxis protein